MSAMAIALPLVATLVDPSKSCVAVAIPVNCMLPLDSKVIKVEAGVIEPRLSVLSIRILSLTLL